MPKVRTAEEWTALAATLEQRINQKFEYCELILDSKNFINCTFTHVSLFYDGIAPTTFSNCEFDDDTVKHFHTHNPGIAQWMETARSLGLLKPGAKYAITPLPSESAKVEALGNQLRNQQWRQISSEQKQQFQDALRGEHPEIWRVYCVKANLEAQNYSMQLMKMFRDCGIMINEIPDKDEDRSEFDRHRLVVLVKNVDSLAPNALTLTKALDAANIAYYLTQANVGRTAPDTYFALRIGPKAKPLRP